MTESSLRKPKTKLFIDICYFITYGFLLLLAFSGFVVLFIMLLAIFNKEMISGLNLSIPVPFSLTGQGVVNWPDGTQSMAEINQAVGALNIQSIAKSQFLTYFGFRLAGIVIGCVSVWFVLNIIKSVRKGTFVLVINLKWLQWVAVLGMLAHVAERMVILLQARRYASIIDYNTIKVDTSSGVFFEDMGTFFLWLFILVMAEVLKAGHRLNQANNTSTYS